MFKIKNGKITYNEFHICPTKNFDEQIYSLKEDLLQINFENKNILIDVGWYPEFDPKGSFIIKIIKNFNWEAPLFETKTRCVNDVYRILEKEINKIEE